MNQADFENILALALINKAASLPLSKKQWNFETAATLLLRHIRPVTTHDIESKVTLLAPAFEADSISIEKAVWKLATRFLPCHRIAE